MTQRSHGRIGRDIDAGSGARGIAGSLALGASLSVVTSASVLLERVTEGNIRAVLAGNMATMSALVAAVVLARGRRIRPSALAGLAVGVVLVHVFVRLVLHRSFPWLVERPAQFVNDGVAAVAALSLAWAFAQEQVEVRSVLAGASVIAAYAVTRGWWHLDLAPRAFETSVQHCVIAGFLSAVFGLLFFRLASMNAESPW